MIRQMQLEEYQSISNFWVVGINYRKADTAVRGQYAVNTEQYEEILLQAPIYGIGELFVLSTCNRTEIYGITESPEHLVKLLCSRTKGDETTFRSQCYSKRSQEAILHLYNVAAGLDSQILGDYEIVSQIKESFKIAGNTGRIGAFTSRLYHSVLQSSRDIRSKTDLSSGTVSVAFAAVQYAKSKSSDLSKEKILIIGSGKMGIAASRNLVQLTGRDNITIINRTAGKAEHIAQVLGIQARPFHELENLVRESDIIIVATNAPQPILNLQHFRPGDAKVLIDLSVPNNVDPMLGQYHQLHLVNVDELSKVNDETLRMRMAEVPKARNIINFHIHQFAEWYIMQKNVPYLRVMKEKLKELNNTLRLSCPFDNTKNEKVQHTINHMAERMKTNNAAPGCTYIETLSGYLAYTHEK